MGIMGFLRERMGKILAFFIGLALLAFIVSEVVRSGGSFFRDDSNELAVVNGEKVPYDKFNAKLEQASQQFKQQGQSISPQIASYLQETTWNQYLSQLLLGKEIEKLGLIVGDDEMNVMIGDNNPDPQIARQFSDPQTGQFDRSRFDQFKAYIQSGKADPAQKKAWSDFVIDLIEAKKATKYMSMVTNGLYVNSLEATDDYEAKNKLVNFKYTMLDYASIPDAKVTLTDGDYSAYYDAHKSEFKNPQDSRNFEYVSFNASPSKEDSAAVKQQVEKIAGDFKASTNDSLFVQINAETKAPLTYQRKGSIDPKLDTTMFNAAKGFVYGPYLENGSYKVAKLIDTKTTFDSVKTKHILIDLASVGGSDDKAKAKADSIKKLIQGGKSFAELATTFSADKGSATKGGELPSFDANGNMGGGQGTLVPEYYNAAFKAAKGEIVVAKSQFGYHVIQVVDQKGSVKLVKVGVVDKPLTASSKTQTVAYSNAQKFLASLTPDNFDAEAKKEGLKPRTAEDVTAIASGLPGLDNARDVVRWAYKAEVGDITDKVFTVGDQYIITRLTAIKPKGILPLEAIKKQIEPAVRAEVKAKQLKEKFDSALSGGASIDQVAQKVGGKVVPVENIVFANPIIPGLSAEYKVIGSVFGSSPNKISKAIDGTQGVYVFVVNGFTNPPALTNVIKQKEQIGQAMLQRSQGVLLDALKDNAIVKDNRAKFF